MNGRYIYAIVLVPAPDSCYGMPPTSLGQTGIGGRGDEVYLLSYRDIGAFISASPTEPYALSRENMLTHERTLEALLKYYTLLPMQFSTIAESEEAVLALLEREYERFRTMLENLQGKKELGLKAIFYDSIFQDILQSNADIQRRKMELERTGASQAALIEIGKMVEAALEAEKRRYREEILAHLRPLALETVENKLIGEKMLLNAAFLVAASEEERFDQKVNDISESFGKKIKFKYVGTLPPYNFARLSLSLSVSKEV
ncbi:MAG: GvpL/GvpF family gas vesicle protein [Candidatus Thermochlorobacter sp.]